MESINNDSVFTMALDSVHLEDIKEEGQNDQLGLMDNAVASIDDVEPLQHMSNDQVHYLQVVDANNEVQYIQISCDDGTEVNNLVQLLNGSDSSEHLVIQYQGYPAADLGRGHADSTDPAAMSSVSFEGGYSLVDNKMTGVLLQSDVDSTLQNGGDQSDIVEKKEPIDQDSIPSALDLNRPITLTKDTIVVIGNEKCVLRLDPSTQNLVAYPIRNEQSTETANQSIVKRKRGRPPKSANKPSILDLTDQSSNSSVMDAPKSIFDDKVEDSEEEKSGAAECLLGLADGRRKSVRVKKLPPQLMDYEIEPKEDCSETPEATQSSSVGILTVPGIQEIVNDQSGISLPKLATPNQMQNFLANLGLPVKRGRGRPRRKPLAVSSDVQRLLPVLLPKLSPPVPVSTATASSLMKETAIIIQQEDGSEKHILVSSAGESSLGFTSLIPDVKHETEASGDHSHLSVEDNVMTTDSCEDIQVPSVMFQTPNNVPSVATPVKIGPKMNKEDMDSLRCFKCDFQALYSHQLQQHIMEQHCNESAELFKCKCCTFLSFSLDSLTTHIQESHPKCICHICGFTAEHSYIVKRHMQRHDATGCQCSVCGKKYKDQYILKMHFKMVHMPAEVLFQCQICSKVFTRKAHLKRHLRIHNPDKPFKCPLCEYRGCERSDINKHLLIHNEPKYSCEVCHKTFRHIKNKELHVRRHQGQRDYTCGMCGFLGYTYTDIRKHIERKHLDSRNVCSRCGNTFKSEAMLREHLCEMVLLEQALDAGGDDVGEECTNETIQLIDEQSLLADTPQVIITSTPVNISLETLALPDESLHLMETPMEQEQIGEV